MVVLFEGREMLNDARRATFQQLDDPVVLRISMGQDLAMSDTNAAQDGVAQEDVVSSQDQVAVAEEEALTTSEDVEVTSEVMPGKTTMTSNRTCPLYIDTVESWCDAVK